MKEYTLIYNAQVTEILTEDEIGTVPFNEDGLTVDEKRLAEMVKVVLDVDDVVIDSVKVFEAENGDENKAEK